MKKFKMEFEFTLPELLDNDYETTMCGHLNHCPRTTIGPSQALPCSFCNKIFGMDMNNNNVSPEEAQKIYNDTVERLSNGNRALGVQV